MSTATAIAPTTFSVIDTLKTLRERLATPGVWAQGGWRGDESVQSENWAQDGCTCLFLGLGDAAYKQFPEDFDWRAPNAEEIYDAYQDASQKAQALVLAEIGVANEDEGYAWNDAPGRTVQDVLNALDLAIAVAVSEEV